MNVADINVRIQIKACRNNFLISCYDPEVILGKDQANGKGGSSI